VDFGVEVRDMLYINSRQKFALCIFFPQMAFFHLIFPGLYLKRYFEIFVTNDFLVYSGGQML